MKRVVVACDGDFPWAAQTKKQQDEATNPPPAKVLCSHFEKSLKKMEGDLVLVKDWLCRVHFFCETKLFSKRNCLCVPLSGAVVNSHCFEGRPEGDAAPSAAHCEHIGRRRWRNDSQKS